MKTNWFTTLLIAGSILSSAATAFAAMPKVGDTAPLFEGQDQDGKTFNLAGLIGKKIVLLYFLPEGFHRRLHERSLRFPRSHGRIADEQRGGRRRQP